MASVMIANFKGGAGKTTLAHHMAVRAAERGLRVLVLDTDQSGDLYRRLVTDEGDTADCPPAEWAEDCLVVHSPEGYALPEGYDLTLVDTPPAHGLAEGPDPDLIIIPIDGVDAARNANEVLGEADAREIPVLIVFNGLLEGGKKHARQFARTQEELPAGVDILPATIPRTGAIKRTAMSCQPAWKDMWRGKDVQALVSICDDLIDIATGPA